MGRKSKSGPSTRTDRKARDAGKKFKKKPCLFCKESATWVDYKDVNLLRRYMSDRAKIRARRVSGNCAQHQRDVATAIKNARELALLPYATRVTSSRGGGGGRGRRDDRGPREGRGPAPEAAEERADDLVVVGADEGDDELKVVLHADVPQLGKKGDLLDVADGYARNFLVPGGLAMRATEGSLAQAESMRRSRDVKDAAARAAAEEVATTLVPKVITITARAGGEGKLFGSVTSADVVEAVAAQTGIEIDRRDVRVDEPIREVGTHRVTVKLHADVEFPVTVEVGPQAV